MPPGLVCYFTDSAGFGGAERSLLTMLENLDRSRWKPALAYHPSEGISTLLDAASRMDVELWSVSPMPLGVAGMAGVPRFVRQLRRSRPDVFHAHLTWQLGCKFALGAAVCARVPAIVASVHAFIEFEPSRSTIIQQRLLARRVDRYLPVSEYVAHSLSAAFAVPSRKLEVNYAGLDVASFDVPVSSSLRSRICRDPDRRVILVLARLDLLKGHEYLLRAAVRLPDVQVVLAGGGPEHIALERLAMALGLADRVTFLGHRDDIADLLAASDLVVLPSLTEGLPLCLLEAMAASKPVVASAVGGTAEAVVDGVTGLLVPPRDPDALADAIARVLAEPGRGSELGRAGRRRVEQHFSVKTMVDRVSDIYEDVDRRVAQSGAS